MLPLFDTVDKINTNAIYVSLPDEKYRPDFEYSLNFLKSYRGSIGTFNSYRREIERLLHWCWQIQNKTLKDLKRDHIEIFVQFCQTPPNTWIGLKKVPRFFAKDGLRVPNPNWRPFIGKPLSHGAVQEIFAILSTFFNFLIAEEYISANPVALIRQKSKFIQRRQQKAPVRRLSLKQWSAVLEAAHNLALKTPQKHERSLFILSILYGMYLRISEVVASNRWVPLMKDFTKDSQGAWWFTTVGKGNKERQIAVSGAMLESLSRWRLFLGLSPLPSPIDNTPLIPKIRGQGPLTDTSYVRRLVQECFNEAEIILRKQNFIDEANLLKVATVHWLRHTGISEDVKIRPREHVRDDAGHSSSVTTDRYVDVELYERNKSAQRKIIIPKE